MVSCVEKQEAYKKLLILKEKLQNVENILIEQILPTLSIVSKTFQIIADFVESKCKKVSKAEKATGNVRDWPPSTTNQVSHHIVYYLQRMVTYVSVEFRIETCLNRYPIWDLLYEIFTNLADDPCVSNYKPSKFDFSHINGIFAEFMMFADSYLDVNSI